MLERGQPVNVIAECGRARQVRAADGREGWLHLLMLEGEGKLEGEVMRRPARTPEDCQRYRNRLTVQSCQERLARDAPLRQEQAQSTYLSGEELRRLVAGKTLEDHEITRRYQPLGSQPVVSYFAPDGTLIREYSTGISYRSTVQDSRAEQVMAEVKRWMPDGQARPAQASRRPPPPQPENRVLGPALSR